jgi:hypothetical protein
MESSDQKRRFPPPWQARKIGSDCFHVVDANGVVLAVVFCRDDLQRWSFGHGHLTFDEARRIANAITRLPEFLMQRRGFYARGAGDRWKPSRPYHVALEDIFEPLFRQSGANARRFSRLSRACRPQALQISFDIALADK